MRWIAKLAAHLLATAALWVSSPDISQKYKMGDISKGWPTHSSPPKNIQIKKFVELKDLSHVCCRM